MFFIVTKEFFPFYFSIFLIDNEKYIIVNNIIYIILISYENHGKSGTGDTYFEGESYGKYFEIFRKDLIINMN